MKRNQRLLSSKEWMENYRGKNMVRGYAKWYGVDLICAIRELRLNGILIDEDYEKKVRLSIEAKRKARELIKEKKLESLEDVEIEASDETFAFISGYTSGGAAFRLKHNNNLT